MDDVNSKYSALAQSLSNSDSALQQQFIIKEEYASLHRQIKQLTNDASTLTVEKEILYDKTVRLDKKNP